MRARLTQASAPGSRQPALDVGQQPCEIEVVGTGLPRGLKIGTLPVAGFVGERLVAPAGFGPRAVVFMIGQEPGQIA